MKSFYLRIASTSISFYQRFIKSQNYDEDIVRKENIYNTLIFGFILLTGCALVSVIIKGILNPESIGHKDASPIMLGIIFVLFLILYKFARNKFSNWNIYIFLILCLTVGTYSMHPYGYILPQGLLIYSLVIIMSSILISSKASLLFTGIVLINLSTLAYLQIANVTKPYIAELNDPFEIDDLIIYVVMFLIIFLVSFLSSYEIDKSLKRARKSERALLAERDLLEQKVKHRTQELEKAQVEKTLELYKFAEFGRLSSSLLHDLASPLTAISIELQQLESSQKSLLLNQVRIGVNHMEQYVQSARKQLRSTDEPQFFDTKIETEKVVNFLQSKAKSLNVKIKLELQKSKELYGDSSKFSQIIANLIGNAIDSYEYGISHKNQTVHITSKQIQDLLLISVIDKGMGISIADLGKIFEPFYTTKQSTRGTGIGLTIIKRIIEEDFNGKIIVTTSKNHGTIFSVWLPLAKKGAL